MNAMAKAGEFKVEFKHQPWDSLFPALKNGDTDIVISGVTITDERKQSMDFTDPYFEITQVVLVPKGKKVASSDDLKNMAKVGVVTVLYRPKSKGRLKISNMGFQTTFA